MYSYIVQDLLNNTFLSLSPKVSSTVFLPSVALQLPEGLQMFACVIADIIERYSEWASAFTAQSTSECGSMQQVQDSQHDAVLKGCSRLAIIGRSRAPPNSLPLAQSENPQQQEMITVFYEGAVNPVVFALCMREERSFLLITSHLIPRVLY